MAFVLDPTSGEVSTAEPRARRADFPEVPAKRPDLVDVIFPGGLVRMGNGRARIYAGLSDVNAGTVELEDPFTRFE